MAIKIGSSITSLEAQQRLAAMSNAIGRAFVRLREGYILKNPAAAGSELRLLDSLKDLKKVTAVLNQISTFDSEKSTAESALNQIEKTFARLKETATASNENAGNSAIETGALTDQMAPLEPLSDNDTVMALTLLR